MRIHEAESQLLLQESEVSIPSRVKHYELLDNYVKLDGTTHSDDCEQREESEETDDLTACTIRPQEASKMLIDLEQFLISNSMHEDANWAHRLH